MDRNTLFAILAQVGALLSVIVLIGIGVLALPAWLAAAALLVLGLLVAAYFGAGSLVAGLVDTIRRGLRDDGDEGV